jgi:hypothetical protein
MNPSITKGTSTVNSIADSSRSKVRPLVVPDVTGLSDSEAAHIYLDEGLMPHAWRVKNGTKASALMGFRFHEFRITHEDINYWLATWRCGLTTSKASGIIALDIDEPEKFQAWLDKLGIQFPKTAQSQTGRTGGYHLVFDARGLADEDWPVQGNIPGGQVKSNGFIAEEPSFHPNGKQYSWKSYYIKPMGDDLLNAIREHRGSARPRRVAPGRPGREKYLAELRSAVLASGNSEQYPAIFDYVSALRDEMSDSAIKSYVFPGLLEELRNFKADDPWTMGGLEVTLNRRKPSYYVSAAENDLLNEMNERSPVARKKEDDGEFGGDWLDEQEFPELNFAVPQIIVEGLTLLVGRGKVGKSLLILRFGLECARGGEVFAQECDKRYVLYLALEDGHRRVQKRSRQLLPEDEPIPPGFRYRLKVKPGRLRRVIRDWLAEHPGGLVLVDVLGKVLEPSKPGETTYERDYRLVSGIKEVSDDHPGSAIVVSHHARKANAEDWLDTVSGTTGITGAADTIIILTRKRAGQDGMLKITGRDVDETEYALVKEYPTGWRLNGADLDEAKANALSEQSNYGDTSQKIIDFINTLDKGETVTIAQVVTATGLKYEVAKERLSHLVKNGHVARVSTGHYGAVGKQKVSGNPFGRTTRKRG